MCGIRTFTALIIAVAPLAFLIGDVDLAFGYLQEYN